MSPLVWVVALVVTAISAAVQGMVGIGLGILSVPVLALLSPDLVPVPQLLLAFPVTMAMVWRERSAIELKGTGLIIGSRIPGSYLGVLLLGVASERLLNGFIAVTVLLAVLAMVLGVTLKRTTMTKLVTGTASGVAGVVASIGGPPVALLYSNDEADTIRSTLSAIFFFGLITSTVFRWWSGHLVMHDLKVTLILLPAVLLGLWASFHLKNRVSKEGVRYGILTVCAIAATVLLIKSITG